MKRTKYPIHPDFKAWTNLNPPLNRTMLPMIQKLMGLLFDWEKSTQDLAVERKLIPVGDGASVRALWYAPKDIGENAPCLVYYHGGGFALPAGPYHYSLAREYAQRARCAVLFVDYRLAPQYPFPTALEDCFAAYLWVLNQAGGLGVDPDRAAVTGDSAGGELSAAVCLMAQERGLAVPCGQMLIYPATGAGRETQSMKRYTDTPIQNRFLARVTEQLKNDLATVVMGQIVEMIKGSVQNKIIVAPVLTLLSVLSFPTTLTTLIILSVPHQGKHLAHIGGKYDSRRSSSP